MRFVSTKLPGVTMIEPDVYRDDRGFFLETYHARKYHEAGIAGPFVQDNHSCSKRGTVRGLHAQRQHPQGKLVRALRGEIFDVAVDVRRGSPTFLQWVGLALSAENFCQLYVPPGFLHGLCVVSEWAEVEYKCTDLYDPTDELGVIWNAPEIGVAWPVDRPILSAKDAALPPLSEVADYLPIFSGGVR